MPAASGPNQWSRQAQIVVGGEATYCCPAGWAVDVQDVGNLAGDQADVGLRPASPPSRQVGRIAGSVVQAVWGPGMLADGPTSRVAARAEHPSALDGVRRDRMVQREHAITKVGVGQRGRGRLVGWPHQASLAVPF
jgi:hypothetical protein